MITSRNRAAPMLLSALFFPAIVAAQTPLGSAFTYQGQLKASGQVATGLYDLQVCLFDGPVNPLPMSCAADFIDVPVEDGLFAITLDFGSSAFFGQQRWLELRVRPGVSTGGYAILAPRQLIRPAPEALRAAAASAAPWSGLSGMPSGFADGSDDNSGGTVTSITAGTGLSGGTINNSGTFSIATSGVGLTQIDTNQVQARVAGACAVGEYLRSVNANGTVVCGSDSVGAGTVTSITAGTGLNGGTITNNGTIGIANGGVGAAQIAAGAVGLTHINTAQVQSRIAGSCDLGTYLRGINPDGSVLCAELPGVSTITTVDDPPNTVDNATSIAIGTDGLPVISYWDATATALKVAKCANAACSGISTLTIVDNTDSGAGEFNSIAIGADGFPVISYRAIAAGGSVLKVAKCVDPACAGAATLTTVDDPANQVGLFTSIAVGSEGLPVISYQDSTASALKVAKCSNAACTGVATITTVDDPTDNAGTFNSIAIGADGLPVVSYRHYQAGTLVVAKCANAACTGAATITTVDDPVNIVGAYTSIAIGTDGLPVISYLDSTAVALKVAKCATPACTGAATITTLDDSASLLGGDTAIAVGADGLPVISYADYSAGALKVAKCANPACTGAATLTTVDDPPNAVGEWTSIAIGNDGLPIISYRDLTAGALKVVKCGSRSCQ